MRSGPVQLTGEKQAKPASHKRNPVPYATVNAASQPLTTSGAPAASKGPYVPGAGQDGLQLPAGALMMGRGLIESADQQVRVRQ